MSETIKESRAQRAERLKGALNPWSAVGGGHAHAGGPRCLHRAEHDGRHSRSFPAKLRKPGQFGPQSAKVEVDGRLVDAYYFCVGG